MKLQRVFSRNKFWNIKSKRLLPDWTEVIVDSLLEARLFDKLYDKEFQEKYNIKNIEFQKSFELIEWYSITWLSFIKKKLWKWYEFKIWKIKNKWSSYIADFVITLNNWIELVVDAKWVETDVFKLKKKLFELKYNKQLIAIKKDIIDKWYFEEYLLTLI